MRRRYFLITFLVLILVTVVTVFFHSYLLRRERLEFIDQQVRATAAALVDSELSDLRKFDFDRADEIISEELGESRIGKFFVIHNSKGETIFESSSATLLPMLALPHDVQWFELRSRGKYIRGLNLKLPRIQDRTLQVGVILDDSLVDPGFFTNPFPLLLAVILFIGLGSALLLTSFLLRPIASISAFLAEIGSNDFRGDQLPALPPSIAPKTNAPSNDEFENVLLALNRLIERVNRHQRFSKLWAFQMAHELKTPLAIATIELEKLQDRRDLSDDELKEIAQEHRQISEIIGSFLGWAELENTAQMKNLHLNSPLATLTPLLERLPGAKDRVDLDVETTAAIPANRAHFDQLMTNVLGNALLHSPPGSRVLVRFRDGLLEIENQGVAPPEEVLARLGEPFNRGSTSDPSGRKGHGLGLAWAISICRLYDWNFKFASENDRILTRIRFKMA